MTAPLRLLSGLLVAASAVLFAACDSTTGGGTPAPDFDRPAMLAHYAEAVIRPAYAELDASVEALDAAVEAFAEAPSAERLAAAQARLKAARLAWQDANLFQFGPAETTALRTSINTYPVDVERVEANVASGSYVLGAVANRAAAGFPTLGYLLHGVGATDADVLAAYADAPDAAGRRDYLRANAAFVREAVAATAGAWAPNGAYTATFLDAANAGTDVGSSLGMLLNAFLLHYERFSRDGQIGIPAGVRSAGVPRPTLTEAFYGGYSAELAAANLRATRRLFRGDALAGASGAGLDDYLAALGADALAAQITAEFDEAVAAVGALDDPLSAQIERDNAPVLTAFQQMQDVVVLLKADMMSLLGVTVTAQDNDGD